MVVAGLWNSRKGMLGVDLMLVPELWAQAAMIIRGGNTFTPC